MYRICTERTRAAYKTAVTTTRAAVMLDYRNESGAVGPAGYEPGIFDDGRARPSTAVAPTTRDIDTPGGQRRLFDCRHHCRVHLRGNEQVRPAYDHSRVQSRGVQRVVHLGPDAGCSCLAGHHSSDRGSGLSADLPWATATSWLTTFRGSATRRSRYSGRLRDPVRTDVDGPFDRLGVTGRANDPGIPDQARRRRGYPVKLSASR